MIRPFTLLDNVGVNLEATVVKDRMKISNPPDSISWALSFIINNPPSDINGNSFLVFAIFYSSYRSKNGRDSCQVRRQNVGNVILKCDTIEIGWVRKWFIPIFRNRGR